MARIAGVSSNTVSRVVRGDPEVAAATRQRISEILDTVGYRPNFAARALAAKRTGIIQVILAAPMYHGHGQTLLAVMNEAASAGFTVMLKNAYGADDVTERDAVPFDVDGVIILGGQGSTVELALQAGKKIPTVLLLANENALDGVSTVSIDNAEGSYLATKHLISQGCTRLVHIQGEWQWSDARQRLLGCEKACTEAGVDLEVLESNSWDSSSGYDALSCYLDSLVGACDLPCGVVAANDQLALGALRAAHERGISIPQQMKLVGFDDVEGAAYFVPPLSTVRQHFDQAGAQAVAQIQKLLAGESPQGIIIQPELVIRTSSTN